MLIMRSWDELQDVVPAASLDESRIVDRIFGVITGNPKGRLRVFPAFFPVSSGFSLQPGTNPPKEISERIFKNLALFETPNRSV